MSNRLRWTAMLALVLAALAWLLRDDRGTAPASHARPAQPQPAPHTPALLGLESSRSAGRPAGVADGTPTEPGGDKREALERPWPTLQVDAVEGTTGRTVQATWNFGSGRFTAGPFPPGAVIDEAALARQREGLRKSLAAWKAAFVQTGAALADALDPDRTERQAFVLRPAPGFVPTEAVLHLRGPVAAGVRHARFVQPVWREAVLDLRVCGPDGALVQDVHVVLFSAAGRTWHPHTTILGPGELRLRGIPQLTGEPVRVVLDWGAAPGEEEAEVTEVEEHDALADAHVKTTIPVDLSRPWQVDVRLTSLEHFIRDTFATDNDLPYEESFGTGARRPAARPPASVVVRALGHDGRPVPDASIGAETANAAGEILLEGLPRGAHTFLVSAPGRFDMHARVDLQPGQRRAITVREPLGARLHVLVTDAAGRPRPAAAIHVVGRTVFDVVDGVQRLDPFTDERGRRTLARVEPGTTTVRAIWGSRSGAVVVALKDCETSTVRIVAE